MIAASPALLPFGWVRGVAIALAAAVVLLSDPWVVLAMAIALGVGWCGYRQPAFGVGIVAATIPLQEAILISTGPAELTVTQLTVLPLIAGWSAAWLLGRVSAPVTPPIVAWLLVTGAMALSIVNAVDRAEWAKETYRWAIALALFMVASSALRRSRDAWPVVAGVSAGILLATGVALQQVIQRDGPPSFASDGLMRAYGFFGQPNPLAAYLEMSVLLLAPVSLTLFQGERAGAVRRFAIPLVVLAGCLALALTQSRGGMLGFVAGAVVIAWCYARWSRLLLLMTVLVAIPLFAFAPPGQTAIDRFSSSVTTVRISEQTTPANWSVHERIAHWRAGLNMVAAEPVTGIGAGNFDHRYREFTDVWRFRIPRGHAHNGLIQVAAQSGLIGLVAYLTLFFVAGARIARGVVRAQDQVARALALGAMGVLIAVTVHGLFDYLHGLSLNLAFVIALSFAEPALRSTRNAATNAGSEK